jgi:hypothetical protein
MIPSRDSALLKILRLGNCSIFDRVGLGCRGLSSEAAQEKAGDLAAPDYLDEKEREVFDLLRAELSPTALEVRVESLPGCTALADNGFWNMYWEYRNR